MDDMGVRPLTYSHKDYYFYMPLILGCRKCRVTFLVIANTDDCYLSLCRLLIFIYITIIFCYEEDQSDPGILFFGIFIVILLML